MLSPFFSKGAIQRVEFLVKNDIKHFLDKLRVAASEKTPINLSLGFKCLTADVVMNFTYQENLHAMDAPKFEFPLILHTEDFLSVSWPAMLYFPATFQCINRLVDFLPLSFVEKNMGGLASIREIQKASFSSALTLRKLIVVTSNAENGSKPSSLKSKAMRRFQPFSILH